MTERGAIGDALHLLDAFLVTVSGRDPSAVGSSTPNTAGGLLSVDFVVFLLYAVALFVINWGVRLLFVEPCARRALTVDGNPPARAKVEKMAQAAIEALTYSIFTYIGLMIVPSQPFAWPSSQWWQDWSSGSHMLMRDDMRCYYIMYASRYVAASLSVLIEHKRKDFIEMQTHHTVTVVVVGVSYLFGWNRIGVVIMLLLDPADVPLHLAKMFKYMHDIRVLPGVEPATGSAAARWMFAADRMFEVFAAVFFITRLVMYPYTCWSAHFETRQHFVKTPAGYVCVVCLYTLLLLQAYWFWLILRVAVKLVTTGKVEDVRSDDEDDAPKKQK